MVRSILAVIAGYLAMFIGVSIFFAFVMGIGLGGMPQDPASFKPPTWLYVLELVWSPIAAIAGGYVCAWIARNRPMRHVLVLVALSAVLGIISAVVEAGMKPLWSSLAVVVLGIAGLLIGGRLRLARSAAA
jgi:hypothetical protein